MKFKIIVMNVLLVLLFSANVYAQPVGNQTEFQDAIAGEEISLTGDITFGTGYSSNISGTDISNIQIDTVNSEIRVLNGTDFNLPVRLLYKTNGSLSLTLNNISIKNFSIKGETSTGSSGGAIYAKDNVTVSGNAVSFEGNNSVGEYKDISGNITEMTFIFNSQLGFGGTIYGGNAVTLEDFTGDIKNNSVSGIHFNLQGNANAIVSMQITESSLGGAIHGGNAVALSNFEGNIIGNKVKGADAHIEGEVTAQVTIFIQPKSALGGAIYSGGNISFNVFTGDIKDNSAIGTYLHVDNTNIVTNNISNNVNSSAIGGAIYGEGTVTLENLETNFVNNTVIGAYTHANNTPEQSKTISALANLSGWGGAIYGGEGVILKNFTGSFEGNSAMGAYSSHTISSYRSGLGGAIYANGSITLENFTGSFVRNKAISGEASILILGSNGTSVSNSSGRGGAIYISATDNSTISGGLFQENSASAAYVKEINGAAADMTSGLGGAIFFDVKSDGSTLTLNSSLSNPIIFVGNVHNPGGTGEVYNSIYFGTTNSGAPINANFSVNVEEDAYLLMLDPIASQQNGMKDIFPPSSQFSYLNLNIEKTGLGTWILAGNNDMRSATTWIVSEGTFHLVEDLDGNSAKLDLSHNTTAEFKTNSGTLLLVSMIESGDFHEITAQDISILGNVRPHVSDPYRQFSLGETYELLKVEAGDTLVIAEENVNDVLRSGAYNYEYEAYWREDANLEKIFVVNITGAKLDRHMGGEILLVAPSMLNTRGIDFIVLSDQLVEASIDVLYKNLQYKDYELHNIGGRFGVNARLGDNKLVGLSATISRADLRRYEKISDDYETLQAQIFEAGVQFGFQNLGLDLLASITDAEYAYDRIEAQGEYDSLTIKLAVQLSKEFHLSSKFDLIPYANYMLSLIKTSAIEEDNLYEYQLHMDSHNDIIHTAKAGLTVRYYYTDSIYLEGGVGYIGNFGDVTPSASAYFVKDSQMKEFTVTGSALDSHLVKFNVKGLGDIGKDVVISLEYIFIKGENTKEHSGDLRLKYSW